MIERPSRRDSTRPDCSRWLRWKDIRDEDALSTLLTGPGPVRPGRDQQANDAQPGFLQSAANATGLLFIHDRLNISRIIEIWIHGHECSRQPQRRIFRMTPSLGAFLML